MNLNFILDWFKKWYRYVHRMITGFFGKRIHAEWRDGTFYSSPLLYRMNKFGKGSLSRGEPNWFQKHYLGLIPKGIAEQRQLQKFDVKIDWFEDQEDKEEYVLLPEEVYYLAYEKMILDVFKEKRLLSLDQVWELCLASRTEFRVRYPVYHHYRNQGWIVRSGVLYGTDFVLYKQNPDQIHSHSEFALWIETKKVAVLDLISKTRSVHHVKKDLMVCYVQGEMNSWDRMNVKFDQIILSRWVPDV